MDVAVNLVESYLRLNGYLTLSEFEVQAKNEKGEYETVTDVDIVALRFPGDVYAADVHPPDDCHLLLISDDALRLEDDMIDVIVGEVKQGEAVFNPALTRHEVLHSVLRRVEWIYGTDVGEVVSALQDGGLSVVSARGGGATVRTRLVAFGRAGTDDLHTIPIGHVAEVLVDFMERFDDVLRPAQFKEPAPALLRLLVKIGFDVSR